jgi:hypothetical protein
MPINEIEIAGSSLSLKIWSCKILNSENTFKNIMEHGDKFSIDSELPGFHDCDYSKDIIRGFYSGVVPFEVEHLVDEIPTKTLFKKIETCEFIATTNFIFTMRKTGPAKGMSAGISAATGSYVSPIEFEFDQLHNFQNHFGTLKAIVITNPKDKEVRRVRLTGRIEDYTSYNAIEVRNHGIESVKGVLDTPLGPIGIVVNRKGTIRLAVKKGFIMTVHCLLWILKRIRNESLKPGVDTGLFNGNYYQGGDSDGEEIKAP